MAVGPRPAFRPGALIDSTRNVWIPTLDSQHYYLRTVLKGMEAETESRILTRFERHDEFVALQSEALSLDDGTEASDDETRRRTKLMWNIFNIVRIVTVCLFSSSCFEFSLQNTRNSRIYWTHS